METELARTMDEKAENGRRPFQEFSADEQRLGADTFWWAARALLQRRWFIIIATVLAGIGSIAISLSLPVWYKAETRVLLPESGSSFLGMLESAVPGAASILSGPGGEYTRYLSILTSRTLLDRTVQRFDLENVYETTESVDPRAEAIKELHDNLDYVVALDFDYLSVGVFDRDPQRAANIANYMVEELNQQNIVLTAANARQTRQFIEQRLDEVLVSLDSAQVGLQAFQERHGILDIEQQGAAFFEALAGIRAEIVTLEVQYGALRRQFGDENAQVSAARDQVRAAEASLNRFMRGEDELMPVALRNLPQVSRQYARLYREIVIQANILEAIHPLLEQARFAEENEALAVQVLDPAIPPVKKARPKRAIIVIAATASVFMLVCIFLLAWSWWRANHAWVAERLSHE